MDPLSITVSILTILGASGSVGKAVKRLVSLRRVPDALLALNNEISDFHLIVSKTDALLRLYQTTPGTTSRNIGFAAELIPLLERGKARLLELECLTEYTLTSPDQNGESVLNKVAWMREQGKVNGIQEEIRSIRTNLATLLGVSASSTALTTEVQVTELRFISNDILERQLQSHALTDQILARQSVMETSHERMQVLLQELLHTQAARQTLPRHIGPSTASNGTFAPASTEVDGQWLFGLATSTRSRFFSHRNNTCRCHDNTKLAWKSPDRMQQLLGMLFLGYSASPSVNLACNNCSYRPTEATVMVRYVFPAWFIARVIYFSLRLSTSHGLEQVLRVSTVFPYNSKVWDLFSADDLEGFKACISTREYSPFNVTSMGSTLLHQAILKGRRGMVRLLLKVGLDPSCEDYSGISAFEMAWQIVLGNQLDQSLRDEWRILFPDPDLDAWQFSTLHKTVLGISSTPIADALSQSAYINTIDTLGRTALSWSCQRGDIEIVRFLLANGADTEVFDVSGCSPLAWTVRGGHRNCAEEILSLRAETKVNAVGTGSRAPIHRLAVSGWSDDLFLRLLVRHGADIDMLNRVGESPLMLATSFGESKMAIQLINLGCQIATREISGYNALCYTVRSNHHRVTRKLIECGADHTTELAEEGNFLHLAATYADLETLRILESARLATRDIHQKRRDGTATEVARRRKGVGRQWREAFRAFLVSVTEIRVFGPEEAWSDSDDDVFEEAVERQV